MNKFLIGYIVGIIFETIRIAIKTRKQEKICAIVDLDKCTDIDFDIGEESYTITKEDLLIFLIKRSL